jgi:hypothetical protein
MTKRAMMIALLSVLLLSLALSACGSAKSEIPMAPMSSLPDEVRQASSTTQQAYQFAIANPDLLKEIPCYCGCGAVGHQSNYDCYVQDDTGGEITFDQHALGCSICVDIALDAMRLKGEGKSVAQIKTIVDQTYGQFGPSNIEQ